MGVRFLVPMFYIAVADTLQQALEQASEVQEQVNTSNRVPGIVLIDEKLQIFAYEAGVHAVRSALDYDEAALPYISEAKKE